MESVPLGQFAVMVRGLVRRFGGPLASPSVLLWVRGGVRALGPDRRRDLEALTLAALRPVGLQGPGWTSEFPHPDPPLAMGPPEPDGHVHSPFTGVLLLATI